MSIREPLKDDPRKLAAKMLSDKLAQSHVRMDRIKRLDNNQLAEELLEKVWAQTSIYTEQYDLLEEAIERLKSAQQERARDGARFCPECHALLEEGSVYCDTCGTDTPACNANR